MGELEKDEESGRDYQLNEDSIGVPRSPSASLSNQATLRKEKEDKSDDSDTDSDEDCDKHVTVSTEIDLDTAPLSTNEDPSSSIIESESITSHCSSSTAEDETDGGGYGSNRQSSSKRMTSYRLAIDFTNKLAI